MGSGRLVAIALRTAAFPESQPVLSDWLQLIVGPNTSCAPACGYCVQVLGLGIAMLTPVALTKRPHRYGDRGGLLAAPNAGRRAACAALASAALTRPRVSGTVVVAFTVQSLYADSAGLKTVVNLQGPFTEARLVTVPSKFAETTVETVGLKDVDALRSDIVKWIGGSQ